MKYLFEKEQYLLVDEGAREKRRGEEGLQQWADHDLACAAAEHTSFSDPDIMSFHTLKG